MASSSRSRRPVQQAPPSESEAESEEPSDSHEYETSEEDEGERELRTFDDHVYKVQPSKWSISTQVCVCASLTIVEALDHGLRLVGAMDLFMATCFGHIMKWSLPPKFPGSAFHALMCRLLKDQTSQFEMRFGLADKVITMTARDFCLVSGFSLGELPDRFLSMPTIKRGSLAGRYFGNERGEVIDKHAITLTKFKDLFNTKNETPFSSKEDALKLGLVMLVNYFLIGVDYRKPVMLWLWELVEDLDAWNEFPWGHYIYKSTCLYIHHSFRAYLDPRILEERQAKENYKKSKYDNSYHLYGWPWGVVLWAIEAIPDLETLLTQRIRKTACPRMLKYQFHGKDGDKMVAKILSLSGRQEVFKSLYCEISIHVKFKLSETYSDLYRAISKSYIPI